MLVAGSRSADRYMLSPLTDCHNVLVKPAAMAFQPVRRHFRDGSFCVCVLSFLKSANGNSLTAQSGNDYQTLYTMFTEDLGFSFFCIKQQLSAEKKIVEAKFLL